MATNKSRSTYRLSLLQRVIGLYVALLPLVAAGIVLPHLIQPAQIQANIITSPAPISTETKIITGIPTHITISRIGIDLTVVNGTYDPSTASWSISPTTAQFATITAQPSGLPGTTLIYGHNTPAVFMPTANLQIGDILTLTTDTHHTFTYAYTSDTSVLPTDTEVMSAQGSTPRVALLTCEGVWSTKRRIMYFTLRSIH